MSSTRTIPNDSKYDIVTFDILSEGQAINPAYQVVSISVLKEVNRIPTAKIILIDGDAAEETFSISNEDILIPGKKIHIKVGRDSKNETVFQGIITKHSIKITEQGTSNLIIECKDESVKMTIGRHSKYFEQQKDSEVIETLIADHGLKADVTATSLKHDELVQYHSTNWDFMLSRAEINGLLVLVDDGKVQVKKPDSSAAPELSLLYGSSILEFEAEMEARMQWKSVESRAWDYKTQKLFTSESSTTDFKENGDLAGKKLADTIGLKKYEQMHSGHVLEQELAEWSKASMLRSRLAKIRGRAKFLGFAAIKPGKVVEVQGVGNRFNGNVYVTGIKHEIYGGSWDTQVRFGMEPRWFAQEPDIMDVPAAGLLPAINGLQIGKVVKLEQDPDGEDRIQVRIPVIDDKAQGIWARVACLDAGNNRGTFFRPEIDDEVIVGFINDDPRDAVVLGMLNSSKLPAPLVAKDDNHEKGIFTRSEMRVLFNDDTKTITIDTPAKNSIVIDEDSQSIVITDQNDNKISMEPAGITLDSPKDITIKAGANISMEATANFELKAAQITEKAQGPIKLEGALATLSSQGITEVKGSLVKIN